MLVGLVVIAFQIKDIRKTFEALIDDSEFRAWIGVEVIEVRRLVPLFVVAECTNNRWYTMLKYKFN